MGRKKSGVFGALILFLVSDNGQAECIGVKIHYLAQKCDKIKAEYMTHRPTAKEEEKQKLVKWSAELRQEREQLEQRVKLLSISITVRSPAGWLVRRARGVWGVRSGQGIPGGTAGDGWWGPGELACSS